MSRYKVVKLKDRKYELKKKRDRIHKTIDIIYVSLMLIALIICGINQFNSIIVGVELILMGIVSIPVTIFYIYIDLKGWEPLFWYDSSETVQYISKDIYEKDLSKYLFFRAFVTVFLGLFSIGLPILGILKILQII